MNIFDIDDMIRKADEIHNFAGQSQNTIDSYKTYLIPFLYHCMDVLHKDPIDVTYEERRAFIRKIQADRHLCDATVNHAISEIRFFYEVVLEQPWNPRLMPHRSVIRNLAFVPSKEMVETFIASIDDLKKKAFISLLYCGGLRLSEGCALKCSDIRKPIMRIRVAPGKTRREHYTLLADEAYDVLCEYWLSLPRSMRTRDWLFTQQTRIDRPLYPQFIEDFIPKQEALLGWPHRLTAHSFRHAFATHQYQQGVSLDDICEYLGHSNKESTRRYIQTALISMKRQSPMAGMDLSKKPLSKPSDKSKDHPEDKE